VRTAQADARVTQPPAVRSVVSKWICPICNEGKQTRNPYCIACLFEVEKLQERNRHELKRELTQLVRRITFLEAALKGCP
jgi:hypothetical protein